MYYIKQNNLYTGKDSTGSLTGLVKIKPYTTWLGASQDFLKKGEGEIVTAHDVIVELINLNKCLEQSDSGHYDHGLPVP